MMEWTLKNGSISQKLDCRHYLFPLPQSEVHPSIFWEKHWHTSNSLLSLHTKLPSLSQNAVSYHNSQQ